MGNGDSGKKATYISNVKNLCKETLRTRLKKHSGVENDDYTTFELFSAWLITYIPLALILFAIGIIGVVLTSIAKDSVTGKNPKDIVASPFSAMGTIQDSGSPTSDQEKNCNLGEGFWQLWWGEEPNYKRGDSTYVSLPVKSKGVLYKHLSPINDITTCEFSFVPLGDKANYEISVDGIFQVVVGDNDYWTVSLRANKVVNGPTLPVAEKNSGKPRPHLVSHIKQGSDVRVRLTQKLREDRNYEVHAQVIYTPDNGSVVSKEDFVWIFEPSPQLQISTRKLSIGLIRAKGDKSEIVAAFLHPNPIVALKEDDLSD